MKRILVFLGLFSVLMWGLLHLPLAERNNTMPESMLALGFVLLVAFLFGKIALRFNLPQITGYLLAGIVFGPFVLGTISEQSVLNLQLIDKIALGLIALTAGGEFRYRTMRRQFKTINFVILFQILFVLPGFILFFVFLGGQVSFLEHSSTSILLGIALIIGSLAVATSPATTIAIITETNARGNFTDFVLGVTIFKDIVVVLLFSVALSVARPLIVPGEMLHFHYILEVLWELFLSMVVGAAAGALILLYLKYVRTQTALFLLGFVLFGIDVSVMLHVELVLMFMVAGFLVQNFSDEGHQLIEAIEKGSLPIYVTFFAIAGASLDLPVFYGNLSLAITIVVLRMVTTFAGTYVGGRLTGSTAEVQKLGWMGFVGQAGLTLGLVSLVSTTFPGVVGTSIRTLVIASVAMNQIVGPVLFRYSLIKTGEGR